MKTDKNSTSEIGNKVAPNKMDRRGLLRLGAKAAPVMLTIVSGPVAANTCLVASSFISMATFASRNPAAQTIGCTTPGVNESFWRTQAQDQTAHVGLLDQTVATYFGAAGGSGVNFNPMTVRSVLVVGPGTAISGPTGVLQHLLSLALSLDSGMVVNPGSLNKPIIAGMWLTFASSGGYLVPNVGVTWTDLQIIQWARLNMGAMLP